MSDAVAYTLLEHRHRFASWAAARAAQRGLRDGSVVCLMKGLEKSGAPGFIEAELVAITTADGFDAFHKRACQRLLNACPEIKSGMTYGRAAKLLAVYLKAMIIAGPNHDSMAVTPFIHPPIDSVLLASVARSNTLLVAWKNTKWTNLNEGEYFAMISAFRYARVDEPAFWQLESHWDILATAENQ